MMEEKQSNCCTLGLHLSQSLRENQIKINSYDELFPTPMMATFFGKYMATFGNTDKQIYLPIFGKCWQHF